MACFKRFVFLLLLVATLAGCSGAASPPATPAAGNPTSPAGTDAQPTLTISIDQENGAVQGVLLDEGGVPIPQLGVFLADIMPGPQPGSTMIGFGIASSKRSVTDEQGNFVIDGIKAGSYTLVIYTPIGTATIPPPGGKEGEAILVEISANKVTNVGTLRIKRPAA